MGGGREREPRERRREEKKGFKTWPMQGENGCDARGEAKREGERERARRSIGYKVSVR